MTDKDRLKEAAGQGLITEDNIDALEDFLSENKPSESGEEDSLKFLASYSDFFIAIGLALFSASVFFAGELTPDLKVKILIIGIITLGAFGYWLIKKQRRKLSGLVINLAIAFLLVQALDFNFINISTNEGGVRYEFSNVYKALVLSGAMLFFFVCFWLPASLGIFMLSCFWAVYHYYYSSSIVFEDWQFAAMCIFTGLLTFSLAMWQDIKDLKRTKINSEYAFWLHSASAPMILMGIIGLGLEFYGVDYLKLPIVIFCAFPVILLIALFIDRRSILISSVFLVTYLSFRFLEAKYNIGAKQYIFWVVGGIGMLIIFVGGLWYRIRNVIFSKLEDTNIMQYVPPLKTDL